MQSASVALRKESVDRNSSGLPVFLLRHWSLSARRAWIEIPRFWRQGPAPWVALRKESVDRNRVVALAALLGAVVALRKESVDRNLGDGTIHQVNQVALRKESVDRNFLLMHMLEGSIVALRKESVDRNSLCVPCARQL